MESNWVAVAPCNWAQNPKSALNIRARPQPAGGVRIDPSVEGDVSQCAHEDDLHP
jgi:hypothetical protein